MSDGKWEPSAAEVIAWDAAARRGEPCRCGHPETCPFWEPLVSGGPETVHVSGVVVVCWIAAALIALGCWIWQAVNP